MNKVFKEIISFFRIKGSPNLTAGILCIVAGMIFWFFNALNKDYSTNVDYPVVFLYDDRSYQPVQELPETVLLNMTGVGWNLLSKTLGINSEPLMIRLESPDQTKKIPGSSLPTVITDQITDLTLNYVLTDTLFVDINQRKSKDFILYIDPLSLDLDENYTLKDKITLSSGKTKLTGPASLLDQLGDTIYLQLSDTEIDDDYSDEVTIQIPQEELITRNPPSVTVSFEVEQVTTRTLNIPITLVNFPEGQLLSDSTVAVSITQRESDQIDLESIVAVADYSTMNDSLLVPVLSSYPDNILRISLDSIALKLTLRAPSN